MAERDIVFEIKEHLGVLAKYTSGWSKELNLVSWNGNPPKYDVRDWDQDHERMSRGITLHAGEMAKFVELYLANKNRKVVLEAHEAENRKWEKRIAEKKKSDDNVSADLYNESLPEDVMTETEPPQSTEDIVSPETLLMDAALEELGDVTPF